MTRLVKSNHGRWAIAGTLAIICPDAVSTPSFPLGVWCSSHDQGATCWAVGETHADGRTDSCGRLPDGTEFALLLKYTTDGSTRCETVTHSTHHHVMPPGYGFCSRMLSGDQEKYSYRFSDDDRVRVAYARTRQDKWCQHTIDALKTTSTSVP